MCFAAKHVLFLNAWPGG